MLLGAVSICDRYARIYECECVLAVSYKQHIWDYFTPLCDSLGEGEKLVPSLFQKQKLKCIGRTNNRQEWITIVSNWTGTSCYDTQHKTYN